MEIVWSATRNQQQGVEEEEEGEGEEVEGAVEEEEVEEEEEGVEGGESGLFSVLGTFNGRWHLSFLLVGPQCFATWVEGASACYKHIRYYVKRKSDGW